MIKHAFVKSGYIDEEENDEDSDNDEQGIWETPAEFCLKSVGNCVICQKENLIRCAWCKDFFCIDHALIDVHVCENFKE